MNKYLKIIIVVIIVGLIAGLLYYFKFSNVKPLTKLESSGDQSLSSFFKPDTSAQTTTATFLAVGDIMLSRDVATTAARAHDPLLPFRGAEDLLRSMDFNFANLESPLSEKSTYDPKNSFVLSAASTYAAGLKEYNFQVMNLANNHAFDLELPGADYTIKYLDGLGIQHIGTGDNLEQAWQGKIITAHGIKIGFVGASYASANDGGQSKNNYVARIEDLTRLNQSIATLKQQTDFVVVSMHAGVEYTRIPIDAQVKFAHAAIDDGADLVIGAHPHWVQTTEQYRGKYIFYSLGNFIFDQEFSHDTKEGLTLKVTIESSKVANSVAPGAASGDDLQGSRLGAHVKQIELIPVIIEHYSTPRVATEAEAKSMLNKIGVTTNVITP